MKKIEICSSCRAKGNKCFSLLLGYLHNFYCFFCEPSDALVNTCTRNNGKIITEKIFGFDEKRIFFLLVHKYALVCVNLSLKSTVNKIR